MKGHEGLYAARSGRFFVAFLFRPSEKAIEMGHGLGEMEGKSDEDIP